jgi:hypothetical protein
MIAGVQQADHRLLAIGQAIEAIVRGR